MDVGDGDRLPMSLPSDEGRGLSGQCREDRLSPVVQVGRIVSAVQRQQCRGQPAPSPVMTFNGLVHHQCPLLALPSLPGLGMMLFSAEEEPPGVMLGGTLAAEGEPLMVHRMVLNSLYRYKLVLIASQPC